MIPWLAIAILALVSYPGPDLSGRWVAQPTPAVTPAASRGDMGSGWGSPLTITQDARQLVVEQALFGRGDMQAPLRFVYALDGSETRNTVMIGHTSQTRVSRAAWDGEVLRITTAYPGIDPAGKPFTTEVIHRLTLESPDSLVVEVTRGGALGGQPTKTQTVYKKS